MKIKVFIVSVVFLFSFGAGIILAQEEKGDLTAVMQSLNGVDTSQAGSILNSLGMGSSGGMGFSLSSIIACLIFGSIGLVAFMYGKKQGNFKALVIGIVLMGYPYFITDVFWLYGIGTALCALLYFWRD